MKSKAEIIKGVNCLFADFSCLDCPYCDMTDCVNQLVSDLHTLLNKSDFEVMKEVLSRSNWLSFSVPDLPDDLGIKTLGLAFQEGRVFRIAFDAEGNIL